MEILHGWPLLRDPNEFWSTFQILMSNDLMSMSATYEFPKLPHLHVRFVRFKFSHSSPSSSTPRSRPRQFYLFENFEWKQIEAISLSSHFARVHFLSCLFLPNSLPFSLVLSSQLVDWSAICLPQQSSLEAFGEGNMFVCFAFSIFIFRCMYTI